MTQTATHTTQSETSTEIMKCLYLIYQSEMAGIHRYLHYSFMIMGHNRIPIQKWFREQATECMDHAITIGEKITSLHGHPPLVSQSVEETNRHSINEILEESLSHEMEGLDLYKKLVGLATDDVALEELARQFVRTETDHIEEVRKMLRTPGK